MNSTSRSLAILLLFRPERPTLSAHEIAAGMGAKLSTVYRDLGNLRDLGFVEGYPGERFGLGGGLSVLDRAARLLDPLRTAAYPQMQRLAQETGLTVTLTRLYGTRLLGVDQVYGQSDISIGYERGELVPLFRGCSGKVILSVLGWRRLKAIHARCADEIFAAGLGRDWSAFLSSVRGLAHAPVLWTSGEVVPENVAVAIPLHGDAGGVTASLTLILRADALPGLDQRAVESALIGARDRAAAALSRAISPPGSG